MPQNNGWLNTNASRNYPLDDNATGVGDDGARIHDDVLVDAYLRWPQSAGAYAFLSGLTVSPSLVSAVFLAADSPTSAGTYTPLAAVTVRRPVQEFLPYPVDALYPGAGGFVSFGDIVEPCSIRLATPQQGLLAPRVASAYPDLPIPQMQKRGHATVLTGLVRIEAGPDIEIVREDTSVEGVDVSALVIRLAPPTTERNTLSEYIGPCGARPESHNCPRGGVERISGVQPDCNGNIRIVFRGLIAGPYSMSSEDSLRAAGTTLDQSLGLADVCGDRARPGRFEGTDLCESSSSIPAAEALYYD